jgi:hypothetical protein
MSARRRPLSVAVALAATVLAAAPAAGAAQGTTTYRLDVYHEPGGPAAGEYTTYLDKETLTWSVEGRCDGGPYTRSGRTLTLQDECQSESIYLVKAKGRTGVWEGFGSYAFFELIRE